MPRSLTTDVEDALAASNVCWVLLYELYFPSGTVRFCSAMHDVEWDSNTYLGAGAVSAVEPVMESVSPTALARNIRFSGIDTSYLTAILDDAYQGQTVREYLALCDEHWQILDDPILKQKCQLSMQVVRETLNEYADWPYCHQHVVPMQMMLDCKLEILCVSASQGTIHYWRLS
jgi:hypothetical protein